MAPWCYTRKGTRKLNVHEVWRTMIDEPHVRQVILDLYSYWKMEPHTPTSLHCISLSHCWLSELSPFRSCGLTFFKILLLGTTRNSIFYPTYPLLFVAWHSWQNQFFNRVSSLYTRFRKPRYISCLIRRTDWTAFKWQQGVSGIERDY